MDIDTLVNGDPKKEAQMQIVRREMERYSRDLIRVANPTESDFDVFNDGYKWTVPNRNRDMGRGKGQQVFPRYLAMTYVTRMTDYLLTKEADEAIEAENKRRVESGLQPMTKYAGGEQERFEAPLKTNIPDRRQAIMKQLWLGIEEQYGMDQMKEETIIDTRMNDEELMNSLDFPAKRQAVIQPAAKTKEKETISEINSKKEALINNLSE